MGGCGSAVVGADLEHLRGGDALRVRQVGARHQGTAQRDGVHHAEHATDGADRGSLPEAKALPVTHHDQARQDEDDGREGASGRRNGLHYIVLFDVVTSEPAQHSHGDDGCRNRGSKSQADFEAEVDVGSGEYQCDQSTDENATQCELAQYWTSRSGRGRGGGGVVCHAEFLLVRNLFRFCN